MPKRSSPGRSGIGRRLTALAGLVVIVGGVAAVLFFAGILGSQGGGTTESGIEIEDAVIMDPPRAPGLEDLKVEPKVGSLAPDFEISDFEGSRHRLSDFRGRPVYVNFWASWCTPCLRELPDIQELADRHKDGLVVIAVNRAEPLKRAEAYFANIEKLNGEPGISFTVNGLDPDDTLYRRYTPFPGAMPVSYFLDANGKVIRLLAGPINLAVMEEAVAEAIASAPVSKAETAGSGGY